VIAAAGEDTGAGRPPHACARDAIKTEMLDREEAIRSKAPVGVTQEVWGVFLAYNLVCLEMQPVAERRTSSRPGSASSRRFG
jgi:hypothetical protein